MIFYFPVLGYILGLRWYLVFVISLGSLLLFFLWKRLNIIEKEEQQKLEEICFYMTQMIVSFSRSRKIVTAFEDVLKISEGRLWVCVRQAENKIRSGWISEEDYKRAFLSIEQVYDNPLSSKLHWFLIQVEMQGGECEAVLQFFKKQVGEWKTFEKGTQKQIRDVKYKLSFCILLSGIIWVCLIRIMPSDVGIQNKTLYQAVMTAGVLLLQITYGFFMKTGRKRRSQSKDQSARYAKLWEKLYRNSAHGITSGKAKETLVREVKEAFPLWMMDMLLHLQTESVPQAIRQSIPASPEVMRIPLERFVLALEQDPVSSGPFIEFMEELDIAEVRAMMAGLYAIRNMGDEEISAQIMELLEQNRELELTVKGLKREEQVSFWGLGAAVPMGISVVVMLVDMLLMFYSFLDHFSGGAVF